MASHEESLWARGPRNPRADDDDVAQAAARSAQPGASVGDRRADPGHPFARPVSLGASAPGRPAACPDHVPPARRGGTAATIVRPGRRRLGSGRWAVVIPAAALVVVAVVAAWVLARGDEPVAS